MERYSEYKDSRVKWLGEIPSHWELLKSKYLWKETFENSTSGKEDLLSVSQYTGVTKSKADSRSESLIGYKIVHKDDLVINIMLAWLGGLGVSNDEGVVSPAYCTYKLIRDYNPKFLHYLYKTPMYLAEFARHSTGVVPSRWRMYTDDFGQVVSLLPPVGEQDAIVRYLDAATSKIDKAIAMQQKMIDLLNERKQIIIQNAVTKGLDDKVEMKDSGVEWIGMIPKHWEIIRIKHLAKLQSGSNLTSNEISDTGSYPVYGGNGLRGFYGSYNCEGSYVLIGRQGALCGNINYAEDKFWATEHAVVCYPKKKYNTLWFGEVLRLMNLGQYSLASAQPGLAVERIKGLYVPNPSIEEQNKIALFLKQNIDKIDLYARHCQRQIALLQERKQIIINEVVTGKVKVS